MDHDPRMEADRRNHRLLRVEPDRFTELLGSNGSDDSALGRAVRRAVDDLGDTGNYAAYGSSPVP